MTRADDGAFVFTRPDGRRIPECGPAFKAVPHPESFRGNVGESGRQPDVDDLRIRLRRLDPSLEIDAQTSRCRWLGERMDYGLAIEALQSRDRAGPPPRR